MEHGVLTRKPLVEALVEIQWALDTPAPGISLDPDYKLLLGRFYDRVSGRYPVHEQLPTATLPDELVAHQVQHRFRVGSDRWPLVQIGPGILSVNQTVGYAWDSFREQTMAAVAALYAAHPRPGRLTVNSLLLRYIDAMRFDSQAHDVLRLLDEKMGVVVRWPSGLFDGTAVGPVPKRFLLQSEFSCGSPPSTLTGTISTGLHGSGPALFWDTVIQSGDEQLPVMPEGFGDWFDAAHDLAHRWFFGLVEGALLEEFR